MGILRYSLIIGIVIRCDAFFVKSDGNIKGIFVLVNIMRLVDCGI